MNGRWIRITSASLINLEKYYLNSFLPEGVISIFFQNLNRLKKNRLIEFFELYSTKY